MPTVTLHTTPHRTLALFHLSLHLQVQLKMHQSNLSLTNCELRDNVKQAAVTLEFQNKLWSVNNTYVDNNSSAVAFAYRTYVSVHGDRFENNHHSALYQYYIDGFENIEEWVWYNNEWVWNEIYSGSVHSTGCSYINNTLTVPLGPRSSKETDDWKDQPFHNS